MSKVHISIFSYGSLMNSESLSAALGRPVHNEEFKKVTLSGYKRAWNSHGLVFSESIQRTIDCVFLNLVESPSSLVNGVIFDVSLPEFENLVKREKGYSYIDVSESIVELSNKVIYTFIDLRPQTSARGEAFILESYIDKVMLACSHFGEDFVRDFIATTEDATPPIIKGPYYFTDPDQMAYT